VTGNRPLDATDRLLTELTAAGARIPGEASRLRREQCLRARPAVDVDPGRASNVLDSLLGSRF